MTGRFIDDEIKRDAARAAMAAVRRKLKEVAETPMGEILRAASFEHRRILAEEKREPTVKDAAKFALRIIAEAEEEEG